MATEEQVILQVRRRIADYAAPQTYADSYYQDAIGFALGKLGHDRGTSYATVPSVPTTSVFLLVKLATIEMCYVRSADAMTEGPSDSTDEISSISVPDLSVSGSSDDETDKTTFWLSLADRLQSEYDNETEHAGGSSLATEIQTAQLNRTSLTTGGLANRIQDRGLDAVTVTTAVDGTTVTLSWDTLYDDHFSSYEVYRSTDAAMDDEERISIIVDNHTTTYDDEDLDAGTYYYRVKTVNPNDLSTDSSIVSATVS